MEKEKKRGNSRPQYVGSLCKRERRKAERIDIKLRPTSPSKKKEETIRSRTLSLVVKAKKIEKTSAWCTGDDPNRAIHTLMRQVCKELVVNGTSSSLVDGPTTAGLYLSPPFSSFFLFFFFYPLNQK